MDQNSVKTGYEQKDMLIIENYITLGVVLPPCESELGIYRGFKAWKNSALVSHCSYSKR